MTDLTAPSMRRPSITPLRVGILVVLAFLLLGFVSIVWTPYPVASLDVPSALQDASGAHWLGTDHLGRDVLSLTMKGVLTSFVVSAVAVAIGALLGVPLGVATALLARSIRLPGLGTSYVAALPAYIFGVLFAALFGPSAATLMVAIGLANVPALAVATHDAIRSSSGHDFVAAARLAGSSGLELARRHTLPIILRLVLAQAVAQLAAGVLAEAALSYIGLGTQPPASSLGLLLHDAQALAASKPLMMIVPGLIVLAIVLALDVTSRGLPAAADLPEGRGGAA